MKKSMILASALLGGFLLLTPSVNAQKRMVKMTTSKAAGSPITLQVNRSLRGYTVDWGDGKPVTYQTSNKDFINTIEGTTKGSNITITGDTDWYMLNCANCSLTAIDLSKAKELQSLYCQHNELTQLDVRDMKWLVDLNCSHNKISHFEFTNASNPADDLQQIESLNISHNKFTERYLWRLNNLQTLIANDNEFSYFYVYDPEIKYVDCSNNQIKNFMVLTQSPKISTLNCHGNNIVALKFANDGENVKQLICDGNKIKSINIANADNLTDISCCNNQAKELTISGKARDISSYNAKGNALSLHSLPGKGSEPQYIEFLPQNPFDISQAEGILVKEDVPYAAVAASWNDRNKTTIDLKSFCSSANDRFDATYQWFVINPDGSETEMTKRTSNNGSQDYYGSFGKFAFFTPQKKAYLQLTSKNYGYIVKSMPIAIGDDITGVENVTTALEILHISSRGNTIILSCSKNIQVNIYNVAGKNVWNGTVCGTETVSLPKGVYIVNGKKVML